MPPANSQQTQPRDLQGPVSEPKTCSHLDMDQMKEVQRLVNSIRRAEVKIRKNRETCHQKEVQWQEFQQQLKASFMEQRSAYLKEQEHHRQEEAQFEDQKRSAVEQLKKLVNGGASAGGGRVEHSATKEDAQAWLDFIADGKSDEEEELSDPWLHAALHEASTTGEAGVQAYKQQVNAWQDKQEATLPRQLSLSTPQKCPAQSLPMTPREKPASSTRPGGCWWQYCGFARAAVRWWNLCCKWYHCHHRPSPGLAQRAYLWHSSSQDGLWEGRRTDLSQVGHDAPGDHGQEDAQPFPATDSGQCAKRAALTH